MGDRVLVLGATGFVGRAVVPALLEAGHRPSLLVRDTSRLPAWDERVEVRQGDALDAEGLADACRGADHVVSLVAVRRDRPQPLARVNVEGPRALGEAARAAGVRSVVFVSAVGAGANPRSRYLSSRARGEAELRRSGVPLTVLRFSFVLGEDGGVVSDFARAARLGPMVVIPGGGRTRFQPIVREDVARCIALAVGRADLLGQALDLGGPELLTYGQLFDLFARARGIRKPRLPVPLALLRLPAAAMELLLPDPPVVPDELTTLEQDNLGQDLGVVAARFGFQPQAPTRWIPEHWKSRPR